MWRRQSKIVILQEDKKLFEDAHEPNERQSLDFLRAWIRTREMTVVEYERYTPWREQPIIRKWLRRVLEKKRDK